MTDTTLYLTNTQHSAAFIRELMNTTDKIDAIKLVRKYTGDGLKEAKDIVETLFPRVHGIHDKWLKALVPATPGATLKAEVNKGYVVTFVSYVQNTIRHYDAEWQALEFAREALADNNTRVDDYSRITGLKVSKVIRRTVEALEDQQRTIDTLR